MCGSSALLDGLIAFLQFAPFVPSLAFYKMVDAYKGASKDTIINAYQATVQMTMERSAAQSDPEVENAWHAFCVCVE